MVWHEALADDVVLSVSLTLESVLRSATTKAA
jgi:hypothetical protein